jgi:two-component system, chemotaxis family, protein-glutamate methylesterase/glutaminase
MQKHNIICIAASAGGVESLCELTKQLPANLDATVFVVVHVGPESVLPEILTRCGNLPATAARNNHLFSRGRIYVAPPGFHLSISDGKTMIARGPRENGHRPSADVLFRSAARAHRSRVVGVVLSGGQDDGTAGLFVVKARGGVAIVQDPHEASVPSMPRNALALVDIDFCLPLKEIASLLVKLVQGKATDVIESRHDGSKIEQHSKAENPDDHPPGEQIPVSCPECNGPLYEVKEGNLTQYECFVGHSYSPAALSEQHTEALERALWTAIRRLKERIGLHRQLIKKERGKSEKTQLITRLEESITTSEGDIRLLRDVLDRI